METCVCRGAFSVTMQRQVVDLWLTPCWAAMVLLGYISSGQEFTVHPSMSREAWCLFLERVKRKRREAMKQVCCQQTAGRFIIWSLPGHPDLVSVAFSSTCVPLQGLQTTAPPGQTNIVSSSNSAVNDLTRGLLTTVPTIDFLGFHVGVENWNIVKSLILVPSWGEVR